MASQKVNFNCPSDVVETIDRAAAKEHRDRTSMLHQMIAFYFRHNPPPPEPKKKEGK